MLSVTPPTLATATPLGVATVPASVDACQKGWRSTLRLAGRVVGAIAAAVAAVTAIGVGVAAALLLLAAAAG